MPTTPNYTYNLPIVGGDFETWGDLLNDNTEKLDDDLKAANDAIDAIEVSVAEVSTSIGNCVLKAGSVMTGALTLPASEPTNNLYAAKKQYVDNGESSQVSRYLFAAGLTDADPGIGKVAFNNANAKLATLLFVSTSCTNGKTTPVLANFVDGVVIGLSRDDRTIYYRITSAVDHTTWYTLTVVALDTGITFSGTVANAALLLTFLGYLEPEEAPVAPYTDHLLTSWDASSGVTTVAHGLGHVPSDVRAIFKCTSATLGYAVGDLVFSTTGAENHHGGHTVSANASTVYLSTAERVFIVPRGGAIEIENVSQANWDVILRVWP